MSGGSSNTILGFKRRPLSGYGLSNTQPLLRLQDSELERIDSLPEDWRTGRSLHLDWPKYDSFSLYLSAQLRVSLVFSTLRFWLRVHSH